MKITIDVEESHANFLIELLTKLKFVTFLEMDEHITNEQRELIENRLAHHEENRDKAILWDDLKNKLA